ncbi:hypothetical protein P4H70_03915 [Paenibacillus ehimensis]|uniref:hypothetical protein n=1 Tax=Paenibacillus ehimensis TaxID=79264 RepID=UPI002DC00EF2|nr:hypothetical protein [Paenibacillus ehimensis]MEC0208086.1 hypothetical protein [Paenibacillus ehimensis]
MRADKALFGYNADQVHRYVSSLEAELNLLEERRQAESAAYERTEAELLDEIAALEQGLSELEHMEASLEQWIQRNG